MTEQPSEFGKRNAGKTITWAIPSPDALLVDRIGDPAGVATSEIFSTTYGDDGFPVMTWETDQQ